MSAGGNTNRSLWMALAGNVAIAVSKFVAAVLTGSSAMLTEGVHSLVDSVNQLLLLWGRRAAKRPPDRLHPFGYGRELYFWSFVVAVLVFALGAGVSVYEGIQHIRHPEPPQSAIIAYLVLLAAFVIEGLSTVTAFREFSAAKGDLGWMDAIRRSKDPPTFIILLENGAAMSGILVAAAGLGLTQLLHDPRFDGSASILIGVILAFTAWFLAHESKQLLIGESARPDIVQGLRELISGRDGITSVGEVMTIHSAPDQITAMVSVDFDDGITARDVEDIVASVEAEACRRWPLVRRFYIRPQRGAGAAA